MHNQSMQALSPKELNYIADSISNEELLIKQCAATASISHNPQIQQALNQYVRSHEQHLNILVNALQQHQSIAPTQTQ
jgi:23S rRNA maturation mini-RNase III